MRDVVVFDIESDGLLDTIQNIWVVCTKNLTTGKETTCTDAEAFINSIPEGSIVVGHNILGFDLLALQQVWGIPYSVSSNSGDTLGERRVTFVDTQHLSQFLDADRYGGHSVENFGRILDHPKLDFNDWSGLSDEMIEYCIRDVELGGMIYQYLIEEAKENGVPLNKMDFKSSKMATAGMGAQAATGIYFDSDQATKLVDLIEAELQEISDRVEPGLPERPLKKSEQKQYTLPAKPFKKDGSLSIHMMNFLERHEVTNEGKDILWLDGNRYPIVGNKELPFKAAMTLSNGDDLKNWFMALGWKPTFWNFKKGEDGKPAKNERGQYIKSSPKIQEAGIICPNLEEMEIDIIKDIVRWMSLRNRLGIVKGWLDNSRLNVDHRLSAGSYGIANTHRQKHVTVVNLPKATEEVILGREMRSLFTASPGNVLLGFDAKGLESRVEAHYTYPFDDGEYARELLDGDVHSRNARFFFKDEIEGLEKDDPKFKYYRSKAKNGKYALNWRM